jgi:hypothetical protein
MYLNAQFGKARHDDMLRVAAKDRLAAQARQARATITAIPHPAIARAVAAEMLLAPRPRTECRRHLLPQFAFLAHRLLALVSRRSLRPAR